MSRFNPCALSRIPDSFAVTSLPSGMLNFHLRSVVMTERFKDATEVANNAGGGASFRPSIFKTNGNFYENQSQKSPSPI
jgi:hypothetical protein